MRLAVVLLLLAWLAAAQCEENSWIVDYDGIAGIVSKEGNPVRHATIRLSSSDHDYGAVTDRDGRFSIWSGSGGHLLARLGRSCPRY